MTSAPYSHSRAPEASARCEGRAGGSGSPASPPGSWTIIGHGVIPYRFRIRTRRIRSGTWLRRCRVRWLLVIVCATEGHGRRANPREVLMERK